MISEPQDEFDTFLYVGGQECGVGLGTCPFFYIFTPDIPPVGPKYNFTPLCVVSDNYIICAIWDLDVFKILTSHLRCNGYLSM